MLKDDQYSQIIQLWKSERRTIKLLEVKSSMYTAIRQKIITFQKELEGIDSKDKLSISIIKTRIERLNKILLDLTKLRMHKIIHCLLNHELDKKGLAAEELDLVKSLERLFEEHNKRSVLGEAVSELSKDKISTDSNELGENNVELMTVRILKDLPEIVDATAKSDSKKFFGPFKKEDIVRLPLVYAKALIMKNAADRVDLPDF